MMISMNAVNTYNAFNPLDKFKKSLREPRANANEIIAKSAEDKALKEQTDAFESFLLKSVLDIALKKDEKGGLFGKDASDDIYSSMYNDTMSKAMSGGMGFSKLLYDFLKKRG